MVVEVEIEEAVMDDVDETEKGPSAEISLQCAYFN